MRGRRSAAWIALPALLALLALAALPVAAQDRIPDKPPPKTPEEYQPEEFPRFLQDLRRGEIIMMGTLPITLLVALESYDIYRYFANDRAPEYTPWPFRSPGAVPYTTAENVGVVLSAVSLSFLLAVTDYVIGRVVEHRSQSPPNEGR
jgi:hypothetical protein